jgi:hypothetical protein
VKALQNILKNIAFIACVKRCNPLNVLLTTKNVAEISHLGLLLIVDTERLTGQATGVLL